MAWANARVSKSCCTRIADAPNSKSHSSVCKPTAAAHTDKPSSPAVPCLLRPPHCQGLFLTENPFPRKPLPLFASHLLVHSLQIAHGWQSICSHHCRGILGFQSATQLVAVGCGQLGAGGRIEWNNWQARCQPRARLCLPATRCGQFAPKDANLCCSGTGSPIFWIHVGMRLTQLGTKLHEPLLKCITVAKRARENFISLIARLQNCLDHNIRQVSRFHCFFPCACHRCSKSRKQTTRACPQYCWVSHYLRMLSSVRICKTHMSHMQPLPASAGFPGSQPKPSKTHTMPTQVGLTHLPNWGKPPAHAGFLPEVQQVTYTCRIYAQAQPGQTTCTRRIFPWCSRMWNLNHTHNRVQKMTDTWVQ